jgi:hypothetical protein
MPTPSVSRVARSFWPWAQALFLLLRKGLGKAPLTAPEHLRRDFFAVDRFVLLVVKVQHTQKGSGLS